MRPGHEQEALLVVCDAAGLTKDAVIDHLLSALREQRNAWWNWTRKWP